MGAIGYKGILGVAQQSAFRTAVDATDRVPFMSEGIKKTPEYVLHDYMCGVASMKNQQNVFNPAGGPVEVPVPYTVLDTGVFISASLLLALAMGTNAWDGANSVNQISFLDDLDEFGTIALYKGITDTAIECIGSMINNMTISCSAGEALKATFETIIGKYLPSGGQNTSAELLALPCSAIELATFNQMTFRIGAHGDALATADQIGITSFELTVNNNLTSNEQSSPDNASSHTVAKDPIQPVRNGFREVGLTITVPRYSSDAFITWKDSETDLEADIVFQSGGTDYIKFFLPRLRVVDTDESISGSGNVPQTITLKAFAYNSTSDLALADASTPAGELWIETKDDRTAAILS